MQNSVKLIGFSIFFHLWLFFFQALSIDHASILRYSALSFKLSNLHKWIHHFFLFIDFWYFFFLAVEIHNSIFLLEFKSMMPMMRCQYFYTHAPDFQLNHKFWLFIIADYFARWARSMPSKWNIYLFYSFTVKHQACTILERKQHETNGSLVDRCKKM